MPSWPAGPFPPRLVRYRPRPPASATKEAEPPMSRLVVVSNRVAPIQEGEATAGGLAAGVLDALKQKGGLWFG